MSSLGPIWPGTLCPIPALSSSHSPPCSLTQPQVPRGNHQAQSHVRAFAQEVPPSPDPHTASPLPPQGTACSGGPAAPSTPPSYPGFFLHGSHPWHASPDFTICYLPPTRCQCHRVGGACLICPFSKVTLAAQWHWATVGVGAIRSSRFPLRPPPWSPPSICHSHPMCSPPSPSDLHKMKTQSRPF